MEEPQWIKFFPKEKTPRTEQANCITQCIEFFEKNLFTPQIVLINAPTGVGKTLIGYCTARYFYEQYGFGTNYLVHNKTLEQQILDENLEGVSHTYGRSNFICKQNSQPCDAGECLKTNEEKFKCEYKPTKVSVADRLSMLIESDNDDDTQNGMSHQEAVKVAEIIKKVGSTPVYQMKKDFSPDDLETYYSHFKGLYIPREKACGYWEAKIKAMQSPIALHNYWYYINEVQYIGDFKPRFLLICDEGHKVEDVILSFISFSISQRQLDDLGYEMELKKRTLGQWISLIDQFLDYLNSPMFDSNLTKLDFETRRKPSQERSIMNRKQKILQLRNRTIEEIEKFKGFDKSNWVIEYKQEKNDGDTVKVEFKPIEPKGYVYNTLLKYGMKVIVMSATLLSRERMIDVLGIEDFDDDTHIKYIDITSPFPVENRIIHYRPVSSMSYKVLAQSTDKIVGEIKKILLKHANQKGIIHTKSYQLMQMISERLKDPRILIHDNNTRQDTINLYMKSEKPLVLVSPSIEDGMDFRDDLCRFIIIAKVPYLNLGDPQIKAHANKDPAWYSWKAVQSIIQEAGRGVRHEKDWCSTYILDSNFGMLLDSYRRFFPQWFLDAVIVEKTTESPKEFDDE